MDKNVKLVVFAVAGGIGVYLTYKYLHDNGYLQKWLPSMFTPATPNQTGAGASVGGQQTGAGSGVSTSNGTAAASQPAPKPPAPIVCPPGQYLAEGQCKPIPAPSTPGPSQAVANSQLIQELIGQGVDPTTASTYVAHCGANGQCDQAYLLSMYQQAALGDPNMVRLTDVGGILFNAYQWEYYREQGGGNQIDPAVVFTDPTATLHASEFNTALQNYLSTGGMTGLGDIARLAWTM